jgi:hypothetical protein
MEQEELIQIMTIMAVSNSIVAFALIAQRWLAQHMSACGRVVEVARKGSLPSAVYKVAIALVPLVSKFVLAVDHSVEKELETTLVAGASIRCVCYCCGSCILHHVCRDEWGLY